MSRIHVSWDPTHPGTWRLEQPYERETSIGTITVPAGFETDFASIPRTVRRRFPQWEGWTGAAIVHDWLYRTQPPGVDRRKADDVMLELMLADQVVYGDARGIHWAVRGFGDAAWRGHQEPVQV